MVNNKQSKPSKILPVAHTNSGNFCLGSPVYQPPLEERPYAPPISDLEDSYKERIEAREKMIETTYKVNKESEITAKETQIPFKNTGPEAKEL